MQEDLNQQRKDGQGGEQAESQGNLWQVAERRAQKIEALLNGGTRYGDGWNGLEITRSTFAQGDAGFIPRTEEGETADVVLYTIKELAGTGTLINYQLYCPPLPDRMEDLLYSQRGRDAQRVGEHLEQLIDRELAKGQSA